MPQAGTPDPDWAEEGDRASCTERKSSGQSGLPKEVTLPLPAPREKAGTQMLEREGPGQGGAGSQLGKWTHH